jgi:hypothetical protein
VITNGCAGDVLDLAQNDSVLSQSDVRLIDVLVPLRSKLGRNAAQCGGLVYRQLWREGGYELR